MVMDLQQLLVKDMVNMNITFLEIEGKLEKGQKTVVVEDLISTGGSVIEVVDVLRAAGAEVLGIVSIFTYGMKKGLERLEESIPKPK